jgi:hypothetical protein
MSAGGSSSPVHPATGLRRFSTLFYGSFGNRAQFFFARILLVG